MMHGNAMSRSESGEVEAFVADLKRRGVMVVVDGERFRVRAPSGTLSPAERERLSALLHDSHTSRAVLAELAAPEPLGGTAGNTPAVQIVQIVQIPPGEGSRCERRGAEAKNDPTGQIGQIGQIPPGEGSPSACPHCERRDAEANQVLAQLAASPALPPALRVLSPEKLAILVRWTLVSLTNPRPQWPPPPAPPRGSAQARAIASTRPTLESVIEALGGRAGGPPAEAGYESEGEGEGESEGAAP